MLVFRGIFCAIILVLLSGCATIVKGTNQVVSLDTPGAPGAKCVLTSSAFGTREVTTPANISLPKGSDNITVRCRRRCFEPGMGVIASNVEAMAAGNVILGGPIGLGVDAMTGAMNKYNSNRVQVCQCR